MRRSLGFFLVVCVCCIAAAPAIRSSFTAYQDAKPILEALAEILPLELKNIPASDEKKVWDAWVQKRDQEIRARLALGDADSVINFLMFGVSFTREPRLTATQVQSLSKNINKSKEASRDETARLYDKRVQDLIRGAAAPGQNERLDFVRKTLEGAGINLDNSGDAEKARTYLYTNTSRVLQEQAGFQEALAAAKSLNDATEEFAEISKIYKDRGLSLDTSLPPDYALEEALKEIAARKMLAPGSIKRIGIIGPGLDFTDKHEGLDFYPVQTVQPFAVADSVIRLGLGTESNLEVDVLDLSPRVLRHAEQIAARAKEGHGYVIQLPREAARGWNPELASYWKRFGDRIGTPAQARMPPAALKGLTLRAIRVRPDLLKRMKAFDLDVILQRAPLNESEKFDLLIATNILVYYDTFEQSLALTNISAMLKPGGFLLTNNLLLELPGSRMRSQGHSAVKYSPKESDGDTIVFYHPEP